MLRSEDYGFAKGEENTGAISEQMGSEAMPEISGMELGEAMAAHADRLGISPVKENVLSVEDEGKIKKRNGFHMASLYPHFDFWPLIFL